jgi:iron complex outermembrane receptor protein
MNLLQNQTLIESKKKLSWQLPSISGKRLVVSSLKTTNDMIRTRSNITIVCFLVGLFMGNPFGAWAQEKPLPSTEDLKKLTFEELMNIEVTSVSKKTEKLTEVASAIQVITNDDIRRSGATNIPEALRLAANLQVAQLNSSSWIISARGFNAAFSNKLLVMIDGRTVYSPLFAGVFWDVQGVLLEDIDRIEVISGPGGTLWGANAVNGVINIITKKSSDTQGLYVSAAAGSMLRADGSIRYGGSIGPDIQYRVFARHSDRANTFLPDGNEHSDQWRFSQTGFALDWTASEADVIMLQGNFYGGTHETLPEDSKVDGQNILTRWSHLFQGGSRLTVQGYYDRTWRRDIPSTITDQLETYDLDFNHTFQIGNIHHFVWGGGYRFMHNVTQHSTDFVALLPPVRDMKLLNGFIQDEISVFSDRIKLVLGTKVQHHYFSDFEIQPSARLVWLNPKYTLWGAVSRAIRAPSRIDVDYFIPAFPVPPTSPSVAGGPNFVSEKVTAWELGFRFNPSVNLSLTLSTFYNIYNDLYSVEPLPNTLTYQIQNGTQGDSRGVEFRARYAVNQWWRILGGYTYFYKKLENKPGHMYDFRDLGNDAENQLLVHSILDLPLNFQLDITARYIDTLPKPYIADYFTYDARIAWVHKQLEVSVVGQNLWEARHREFLTQIPRSFYGKITGRF